MRIERDQLRTGAIIAFVLVAFGVGGYLPAKWERDELTGRIEAARQELGISSGASTLKELHGKVAELRLSTREAQRYVPHSDELAQVLRGLTESMNAFGAKVHEVLVLDVEHHRDYSQIPMTLSFEGPFPSAYGVLKQIDAMPRLIRLEKLRIERDMADPGAPVRVRVELSTFYTPRTAEGAGT